MFFLAELLYFKQKNSFLILTPGISRTKQPKQTKKRKLKKGYSWTTLRISEYALSEYFSSIFRSWSMKNNSEQTIKESQP